MNAIFRIIFNIEGRIDSLQYIYKKEKNFLIVSASSFVMILIIWYAVSYLYSEFFWIFESFLLVYIFKKFFHIQKIRREMEFLQIFSQKLLDIKQASSSILHQNFHHLELLEQKIFLVNDLNFREQLQKFLDDFQYQISEQIIDENNQKSHIFSELKKMLYINLKPKIYIDPFFILDNKKIKDMVRIGVVVLGIAFLLGLKFFPMYSWWLVLGMMFLIIACIFLIVFSVLILALLMLNDRNHKANLRILKKFLFDLTDAVYTLYYLRYNNQEKNFDEILITAEKIFQKISHFSDYMDFISKLTQKSQENLENIKKISYHFTLETLNHLYNDLMKNMHFQTEILTENLQKISDMNVGIPALELQKSRLEDILKNFKNLLKNNSLS